MISCNKKFSKKVNQLFRSLKKVILLICLLHFFFNSSLGQPGMVRGFQKISDQSGGFIGQLDNLDFFGSSVANIGDINGDGIDDIAIGSIGDDDGGDRRGAVWILFLNPNGTVRAHQKISDILGGFSGSLNNVDQFGNSIASLGDLDGNGVPDIAVGAHGDDDGGTDRGAVWILFLNPNGTVRTHQKISGSSGGFIGTLDDTDRFGTSLASLGDLDGNGMPEIAVGAIGDDDGGNGRGAVWILFLNPNGTVMTHQKISDIEGNFVGILNDGDLFGSSVASLGDLDGNGMPELSVGTSPIINIGSVWVLFLNEDGVVNSSTQISGNVGGFNGRITNVDRFGFSVTAINDIDGNGVPELIVGSPRDFFGGNYGAAWILFMNLDGTVNFHQKISNDAGSFSGNIVNNSRFGNSLSSINDIDESGVSALVVGNPFDDDGGPNRGSIWILTISN